MLTELESLAFDLTWTWEPRIRALFSALDPELWEETGHNPVLLLHRLGGPEVERRLQEPCVREALAEAGAAYTAHRNRTPDPIDAVSPLLVGYFSL